METRTTKGVDPKVIQNQFMVQIIDVARHPKDPYFTKGKSYAVVFINKWSRLTIYRDDIRFRAEAHRALKELLANASAGNINLYDL